MAVKDLGSNTPVVTNKYHLIETPHRACDVEDVNGRGGIMPALACENVDLRVKTESVDESVDLRVKTRHGSIIHNCVLEVSKTVACQGHVKLEGRDSGLVASVCWRRHW